MSRTSWSVMLLAVVLVLAGGCKKQTAPAVPEKAGPDARPGAAGAPPALPAVDAATQRLVDLAGGDALFTVVIRPQRWKAARSVLLTFLEGARHMGPIAARVAEADSPEKLVATLASVFGIVAWPHTVPGWDTSRPVVLALFDALEPVQSADALWQRVAERDRSLFGVGHRVLVPATDSPALAAAAADLLTAMGEKPVTLEDPTGVPMGTRLFDRGGDVVAVIPADDHVRLEILSHAWLPDKSPAARRELVTRWLGTDPAPVPRTPAVHHLASGTAFAGALARPGRLRAVAAAEGLMQVVQAAAYAASDSQASFQAMALAIMGQSWAFMSPGAMLYEDVAVRLEFVEGLRLTMVGALTARGRQMLDAATRTAQSLPSPASAAPAWLTWRLDLGALAAAVPATPLVTAAAGADARQRSLSAVVDAYGECGGWCSLYLVLGGWPGVVGMVGALSGDSLPAGVRGDLTRLDLAGMRGEGGIALVLDEGTDTEAVRRLFAGLEKRTGVPVQVRTRAGEGRLTVLVGLGGDPERLYAAAQGGDMSALQWRFDPALLADSVAKFSPEGAALLDRLDVLDGRGDVRGKVAWGSVRVPLKARAVPAFEPPHYEALDWTPPAVEAQAAARTACLDATVLALSRDLTSLGMMAPEQRQQWGTKLQAQVGTSPLCAGGVGGDGLERIGEVLRKTVDGLVK